MKCILHIGTEKTGTKTIQTFLHQNRSALSRSGYLYTTAAGAPNNLKLPLAAYDPGRRDNLTRLQGLDTEKKLRAFRADTRAALRRELSRSPGASTVLFSAEHIHSRLTSRDELLRLRTLLEGLGLNDVRILVYLRRPADLAASLYSTAVQSGETACGPPPPDDPYYRNICHHRGTVERFGAVFGMDRVTPRLFEEAAFAGGTLIADFLSAVGLPQAGRLREAPPAQNERLSALGIELLRRVNRRVPLLVHDRPNRLRANLARYFSGALAGGAPYVISADLFLRYEAEFEDSNEWIRARYFPDRDRLFPRITPPGPAPIGAGPEELERIANLLAEVWLDQQTALCHLTGRRSYRVVHALERLRSRVASALGRSAQPASPAS
jgi:hypothetical protein